MPLELGLWRVDAGLRRLAASSAPSERWLEDALELDPSLLALDLLVVGRQVTTSYGKRIDLLALDGEGVVYLVELKRDRTPRDVVAQALDYGSWLRGLGYEDLREIYQLHSGGKALEVGFEERFGFSPPDSLNEEHRLLVVASDLDPSTERIVSYLSEGFGVPINVLSFAHSRMRDATTSRARGSSIQSRPKHAPKLARSGLVRLGTGRTFTWPSERANTETGTTQSGTDSYQLEAGHGTRARLNLCTWERVSLCTYPSAATWVSVA
jgi:hypothetical protein